MDEQIISNENSQSSFSSNKSKTLIIILVLAIVIILVIIAIFFFSSSKTIQGVDLKIINVSFSENNGFTSPRVTIENTGTLATNSSLIFSMSVAGRVIEWQYPGIIQSKEVVVSEGAGTTIASGEEVTIIADAQNQTQDINRKNNIFIYKF